MLYKHNYNHNYKLLNIKDKDKTINDIYIDYL